MHDRIISFEIFLCKEDAIKTKKVPLTSKVKKPEMLWEKE